MTKKEIKEKLDEVGVDYSANALKAELQDILEKAESGEEEEERQPRTRYERLHPDRKGK